MLTKFSDASGRSLSKLELLADLQSDRAAGYVTWQCAEGHHTCKVYMLALPRAGFHRFWELQGIHSGMHLTTSGKQGAAWQTKGIGRWTKVLEKHGLSGASFLLSHTSAASRGEAQVTVHSHAMSTAAVLCLHLHWGHHLKDEGDRQAALRQLEAILSARLADNTIIKVSRSVMSAHCSGFSEDMDIIVASGTLCCQNALARKAILQHTAMPEGWAEPVAAVPFLCRLWRASSNAMWLLKALLVGIALCIESCWVAVGEEADPLAADQEGRGRRHDPDVDLALDTLACASHFECFALRRYHRSKSMLL